MVPGIDSTPPLSGLVLVLTEIILFLFLLFKETPDLSLLGENQFQYLYGKVRYRASTLLNMWHCGKGWPTWILRHPENPVWRWMWAEEMAEKRIIGPWFYQEPLDLIVPETQYLQTFYFNETINSSYWLNQFELVFLHWTEAILKSQMNACSPFDRPLSIPELRTWISVPYRYTTSSLCYISNKLNPLKYI